MLLVRHADPVLPGTPDVADNDRPLTDKGRRDADELARSLADLDLAAVYSSPYRRALETIEPVARRHGVAVLVEDDLRERLLASRFLPDAEWRAHLERCWGDDDHAMAGGESIRQARERALRALEGISSRHPDGTVVAGSHGELISIMLRTIRPSVDLTFALAMPMPAVFRLEHREGVWHLVSGPGV
jgi:2,3-bisphosphoglycerate-dependent phosphoglycerate mutase